MEDDYINTLFSGDFYTPFISNTGFESDEIVWADHHLFPSVLTETATESDVKRRPHNAKRKAETTKTGLSKKARNQDVSKKIITPMMAKQVGTTNIWYYPGEKRLGQGATSIVHQGYFGEKATRAAIKEVTKEHNAVFKKELYIFMTLMGDQKSHHPNVVRLFHWTEYDGLLYFAMEQATWDLKNFLVLYPNRDHRIMLKISYDAALGLQFLHTNNILHRDIKPENVLIFGDNLNPVAKLGDFGVSRKMTSLTSTMSKSTGTDTWMSPEAITAMHNEQPFPNSKALDVFSLGMTIYFIFSKGNHPFAKSQKYGSFPLTNIKDPDVVPLPLPDANMCMEVNRLLAAMMNKRAAYRPTINQVCDDPALGPTDEDCKALGGIVRLSPEHKGPPPIQVKMGLPGAPMRMGPTSQRPDAFSPNSSRFPNFNDTMNRIGNSGNSQTQYLFERPLYSIQHPYKQQFSPGHGQANNAIFPRQTQVSTQFGETPRQIGKNDSRVLHLPVHINDTTPAIANSHNQNVGPQAHNMLQQQQQRYHSSMYGLGSGPGNPPNNDFVRQPPAVLGNNRGGSSSGSYMMTTYPSLYDLPSVASHSTEDNLPNRQNYSTFLPVSALLALNNNMGRLDHVGENDYPGLPNNASGQTATVPTASGNFTSGTNLNTYNWSSNSTNQLGGLYPLEAGVYHPLNRHGYKFKLNLI